QSNVGTAPSKPQRLLPTRVARRRLSENGAVSHEKVDVSCPGTGKTRQAPAEIDQDRQAERNESRRVSRNGGGCGSLDGEFDRFQCVAFCPFELTTSQERKGRQRRGESTEEEGESTGGSQ